MDSLEMLLLHGPSHSKRGDSNLARQLAKNLGYGTVDLSDVIAVAVAIGVEIHAIFHLSCDFLRLLRASPQKCKPHLGSGETGLSFLNHST
ncbi:hypothetical protein S83_022387, partial [Arachis hypogaea]